MKYKHPFIIVFYQSSFILFTINSYVLICLSVHPILMLFFFLCKILLLIVISFLYHQDHHSFLVL